MVASLAFKTVMDGEEWRCRPFLRIDTPSGHQDAPLRGITPRRQTLFDLAGRILGARPLPLAEAVEHLKASGMQPHHLAELFGESALLPPPCGIPSRPQVAPAERDEARKPQDLWSSGQGPANAGSGGGRPVSRVISS